MVYGLPTAPHAHLKSPINSSSESRSMPSSIVTIPSQLENIIIGALISAASLFVGSSLLDIKRHRQTRPDLQIDSKENPNVTTINLPIYDISKPDLPSDLMDISRLDLQYRVNRIKVKNNGNSAAEDCKGLIIQDDREMRVCWSVPSERIKMTINAKSSEYLDLCAFLVDDSMEFAKILKENISNLRETYPDSTHQSVKLEEVRKLKHDFIDQYSNDNDYNELRKKYFPLIIAPTENDWQPRPHLNRILKAGAARIRITSKNASPFECNITIL